MKPRLFQSLSILVAVLVSASADPQTYYRRRYYHDELTLPSKLTHHQALNTVNPVTKPMPNAVKPPNTGSKDSESEMQGSASAVPTASNSQCCGGAASATPTDQKPSAKLPTPNRRVKKTSVTGVPLSTEEKSSGRPRAMTLPR